MTPINLVSPREMSSRRDSQTTCETLSIRTSHSHSNSRRDSGMSLTVKSRRNSDIESRILNEPQMFPDLPSATPATALSAEAGALKLLAKNGQVKQESNLVLHVIFALFLLFSVSFLF